MFLAISQENTGARVFFKVAGLTPATLLKKRLWHGCFPVNFEKFLGTPFLTKHLPWLLLQVFTKLFTAWRFHKFDIVRQRTTNKLSWEGKIPSKYVWQRVIFLKQELPLIRKSNYLSLIETFFNTYYLPSRPVQILGKRGSLLSKKLIVFPIL